MSVNPYRGRTGGNLWGPFDDEATEEDEDARAEARAEAMAERDDDDSWADEV